MVTKVNWSISAGCSVFLKTRERNVQNKSTPLQLVPHSSHQLCAYKTSPGAAEKKSLRHTKFSHQTQKVAHSPSGISNFLIFNKCSSCEKKKTEQHEEICIELNVWVLKCVQVCEMLKEGTSLYHTSCGCRCGRCTACKKCYAIEALLCSDGQKKCISIVTQRGYVGMRLRWETVAMVTNCCVA